MSAEPTPGSLDLERRQQPPFFSSAILKLTEYCNIKCTYCYMFEGPNQHASEFPLRLSDSAADQFLVRLAEYIESNGISRYRVTLHGGEPTLWPLRSFERLFRKAETLGLASKVSFSIQSNLYQLKKDLLPILLSARCSIGVSIDGPASFHDSRRKSHGGLGTYAKITENVEWMLANGFGRLVAGYLTVANPQIPPTEFLQWARGLRPSRLSVLWPIDFNHNVPAPNGLYGNWYASLFREWLALDDPSLEIRYFRETITTMCGGNVHGDSLGVNGIGIIVVDTDGSYVHHDYVRGFLPNVRLHRNVFKNSFQEMERDPILVTLKHRRETIPRECATCDHVRVCGGGFLANRLHGSTLMLDKKSVMCGDHIAYFSAVRDELLRYGARVAVHGDA